MAVDTGLSTEDTKHRYKAIRPFVAYGETNCTPDEDEELRADGSYPSGHTALGWGMALALATIDPDSAQSVLARGRAFGESRMICNVHWQSDIIAGRFMASATTALLHAVPEFREDMRSREVSWWQPDRGAPGRRRTAKRKPGPSQLACPARNS